MYDGDDDDDHHCCHCYLIKWRRNIFLRLVHMLRPFMYDADSRQPVHTIHIDLFTSRDVVVFYWCYYYIYRHSYNCYDNFCDRNYRSKSSWTCRLWQPTLICHSSAATSAVTGARASVKDASVQLYYQVPQLLFLRSSRLSAEALQRPGERNPPFPPSTLRVLEALRRPTTNFI